MPHNGDIDVARQYHDLTIHTHFSVRTSGHWLDFDNKPLPFKIYEDLEPIPLAPHFQPLEVPLGGSVVPLDEDSRFRPVDLVELTQLLFYSAGVTGRRTRAGGDVHYFRAAACTGALYEIDLYVACGDLGSGVSAGLYHFSPQDFSLRRLRDVDCRGALALACGRDEDDRASPDVVIVCGANYWRNAWKYQARTYRHFGWDNGTILANMQAVARLRRPFSVRCGFIDDDVNHLLGLDPMHEVAFSVVMLGARLEAPRGSAKSLPVLSHRTRPLSPSEVDYPLMRKMHAASCLDSYTDLGCILDELEAHGEKLPAPATSQMSLHDVVMRRGSTRRFSSEPITAEQLSALLHHGFGSDWRHGDGAPCRKYVIVHAVEGVEPGAYFYGNGELELLKRGNFRNEAAYLDLEQDLAGDAAVNIYYMADLEAVLKEFGNRGYRIAQLEAGIEGGHVYLAAYSLGLGATGLTFFDQDVTRFFSPHAAGRSPMFLMAAGHPYRRAHTAETSGA